MMMLNVEEEKYTKNKEMSCIIDSSQAKRAEIIVYYIKVAPYKVAFMCCNFIFNKYKTVI